MLTMKGRRKSRWRGSYPQYPHWKSSVKTVCCTYIMHSNRMGAHVSSFRFAMPQLITVLVTFQRNEKDSPMVARLFFLSFESISTISNLWFSWFVITHTPYHGWMIIDKCGWESGISVSGKSRLIRCQHTLYLIKYALSIAVLSFDEFK